MDVLLCCSCRILFVCAQGWTKNYPKEPAFFVPKLLEQMVRDVALCVMPALSLRPRPELVSETSRYSQVAKGHLGRKTGQGFYKWAGNKQVEE